MTGLLLGLQTVQQQRESARRELAEASNRIRSIQQNLRQIKTREARLQKLMATAKAREARADAMEKAKIARERAEKRQRDIANSKFRSAVASTLTDVRYDTGSRKTKRSIRKLRKTRT